MLPFNTPIVPDSPPVLQGRPYPVDNKGRIVKIDSQVGIQPIFQAKHRIIDSILNYEMPTAPAMGHVIPEDVFDFIFGNYAYHGQSSASLAVNVVNHLTESGMVEQIPLDGNRERRKYHWKKMFPRCIDDEQYETLPLEYVDAPDFHAPRSAANHEENIATLFETIACIAHSLQPRPDYATHPRRVRSCHDRLIGKRRKPDVVILQDALDVTRGNTHIDWHHVASVGEIKYADSKVLKHDAEAAVVDTSWFALHSTFGRRYVVSFVLCGPVMRLCMVDHGGKVTSIDIDLELQTNAAVQCIIALTMGPDETLGDDKTINAFRVNHGPHNSPTDSESRHTMQFDGRKYHIDARVFLNPSALGRATSIYAAIESTTKSDGTHNNQVAIKDFWPEPTVSFEMDYLKYIHSVLEEKRTAGEPNLPPSTAFPEPIGAELVKCTDPRTGEEVVDSTHLRRRGAPALMYERRIHCRIGFRQVAVDLTWFATRKEFFEALLTSLEAHKFAVNHCKLLHKDISPNNIFIVVDTATPENVVPDNQSTTSDEYVHPHRKYQLGDWGLCLPLQDCQMVPGNICKIPDSEWSTVGGHSGVTMCLDSIRAQARESQQTPLKAFNRTGAIGMMATALLSDPHGQFIPHQVQHDLESHFWTALFGLINCRGPFHNIVHWPAAPVAKTTGDIDGINVELIPPSWLRAGLHSYTFEDIFRDRIHSLGNWESYRGLIQPYWRDNVILDGMEKMFDIFMSKNMLIPMQERRNVISLDPAFNKGLVHDQLIDIVKEILTGIDSISETSHMIRQSQLPPLHVLIKDGRNRYTSNLQFCQLPPLDESDEPNHNLEPHPADVITQTTTRQYHTRRSLIDDGSGTTNLNPPSSESNIGGYGVMTNTLSRSVFSGPPGISESHDSWPSLTDANAFKVLEGTGSTTYSSLATPPWHPPGLLPMTKGGDLHRSPLERPSVDDDGESSHPRKHLIEGKGKGKEKESASGGHQLRSTVVKRNHDGGSDGGDTGESSQKKRRSERKGQGKEKESASSGHQLRSTVRGDGGSGGRSGAGAHQPIAGPSRRG